MENPPAQITNVPLTSAFILDGDDFDIIVEFNLQLLFVTLLRLKLAIEEHFGAGTRAEPEFF